MSESVYARGLPDGPCHVHDWPTAGMARRLFAAMRERHGKGGVNVCRDCLTRARDDAKAAVDAGDGAG